MGKMKAKYDREGVEYVTDQSQIGRTTDGQLPRGGSIAPKGPLDMPAGPIFGHPSQ
jgi:hypothetical protein